MRFKKFFRGKQSEIIRYLGVGGWNTLFGMGAYATIYKLWGTLENYLWVSVVTNILAITNAYLCYKFIVFRTRGNYLREYLKCYAVYGVCALLGMFLLFILVSWLGLNPVLGNIATTALTVVFSYIGHKYFSFRRGKESNLPS